MLYLIAAASLLLSASQVHAHDGCNDPDYFPCPPQTNSGGSSGGFGATLPPNVLSGGLGFPSNVQSTGGDPIQGRDNDGGDSKRRLMIRSIAERQNTALCCRPAPVQCRLWTEENVPFCYDPSDTRWFFADGSEYFANNATFLGADGYDLDFATGDYSWPNGTTGNIYTDQGETPPSASTLSLATSTMGGSAGTSAMDSSPSSTNAGGSAQTSMPSSSASMTSSVATASTAGTASAASTSTTGTAAPKSDAAKVREVGIALFGLVAFVLAVTVFLL
ncbi:hypothetical protein MMC09_004735 [Bachmanniomyces sp. S44760]|nr:hypothetical protein [Bachmanniomyces sp. S44760]